LHQTTALHKDWIKQRKNVHVTPWQELSLAKQVRSQVLRLGGGAKYIFLGKKFRFYFMFLINFSEHNKNGGGTKQIGGMLPPDATPVATGL